MLTVGDRVISADDLLGERGTVLRRSPAGYLFVVWDGEDVYGHGEHFRPETERLQLVTGLDAEPRHDWPFDLARPISFGEPCEPSGPCLRCGAVQNDDNYAGPCAWPSAPAYVRQGGGSSRIDTMDHGARGTQT